MPMTFMKLRQKLSVLGLVFLPLSTAPATAVSLVGTPTQINTPVGANYRVAQVRITADTTGKFAVQWTEDTEPDQLILNELVRFRAFDGKAKAIGPSRKLVGTSDEDPQAIGIQSTGPNKYAAFWYGKNTAGRLSVFRQDFNGQTATGTTTAVFTDSDAAPVASLGLTLLTDGRSLLTSRCNCFPVTVTGQFMSKSAAIAPTKHTLSQPDSEYVPLSFRALAGGGFVGSYLKNGDIAGQVFSLSGKPVGSVSILPVKTDNSLIRSSSLFGLSNGSILSLYGSRAASNTTDIYARVSKANFGGSTSYKKLVSKAFNFTGIALKSGGFLLAYTKAGSGGDVLQIARYSSGNVLVGKPAKINGASFAIRSLTELSNGNVVIAYSDADPKVFVQIIKP